MLLLRDLPRDALAELFTHVDVPFVLRLTCRALRDAHAPCTATWLSHVVASTSLLEWAFCACELKSQIAIGTTASLAIAGGHVPSLEWLRAHAGYVCSSQCSAVAAHNGQLGVLQWLDAQKCALHECTANYAAQDGHVECMKWAIEKNCNLNPDVLVGAARGGHMSCIRHLLGHTRVTLSSYAMGAAASNGHIDAMKLLTSYRCPFNKWMAVDAATSGNLDCLEYALSFFAVWEIKEVCLRDAAAFGRVHVVKWLLEHASFEFDDVEEACESAVYYGRVDVLEALHSSGHEFSNEEHCTSAAERGNVKVLQWLVDHGAVLQAPDLYRCAVEASNREVAVLRWLAAQPAWDTHNVCVKAASYGHLRVLKWVVEECRPELHEDFCHAAAHGGHGGHRKVVKWLLHRRCPYDLEKLPTSGRCSARRVVARGRFLEEGQHLGECLSD